MRPTTNQSMSEALEMKQIAEKHGINTTVGSNPVESDPATDLTDWIVARVDQDRIVIQHSIEGEIVGVERASQSTISNIAQHPFQAYRDTSEGRGYTLDSGETFGRVWNSVTSYMLGFSRKAEIGDA